MTTYAKQYRVNGGDVLEIEWSGSVWVAPCCGAQYGDESDAMRQELMHYLRSCGETVEDVDDLDLSEHGEWIDDEPEVGPVVTDDDRAQEMGLTTGKITARIYWDDQDSKTVGWAWANRVDGDHDATGPLGDGYAADSPELDTLRGMSDDQLIAAYHREVNASVPAEDIEIER